MKKDEGRQVISAAQAVRAGYRPITMPYAPAQQWMLEAVVRDMEQPRCAVRYLLVNAGFEAVEVWRHESELSLVDARERDRAETGTVVDGDVLDRRNGWKGAA